jgi:hypothetical protein
MNRAPLRTRRGVPRAGTRSGYICKLGKSARNYAEGVGEMFEVRLN